LIIALEVAMNAELFRCETCTWGRHCDERNPAPFAKWVVRGVIESRTCLLPMITPASRVLLRFYGHYKQRLLPRAGGLLDQPHHYLEAMEILAAHEAQSQMERAERARK
jgi:hypothetical protein